MLNSDFETDVLVLAFRDAGVLAKYADRLDPLFFKNMVYGNLWLVMRRMFATYRQAPSFNALYEEVMCELRRDDGLKLFTKADVPVLMRVLPKLDNADIYVMDRWVREQLDQWITTRAYIVATAKAERELASGNPHAVPGIFRAATAIAAAGDDQPRDFFDRMSDTARAMAADFDRRMTTGLTGLDEVLAGGLYQGEFGLVFGVDSVGKSFLATHVGAVQTTEGNRVLHITNELTTTEQERRYIAWYTDIPKRELWEFADKIDDSRWADMRGTLDVRYVPPGSTVNEVWGILEAARQEGSPFKLVIVDYLDQFQPAQQTEQKEYLRLIQVASEFSQLAKTQEEGGQDVCIFAVTHADSSGYNKKWGDGSMMGGSKIGKNKVIDFGIFLGQDEDMLRQNLLAVTITKMRSRIGKGGRCYLRQNFDMSKFTDVQDAVASAPQLETPSLP